MPRRALRELVWFLGFLALTLVLTWPLARVLDTAVSDLGDPLENAWILDWDNNALTHGHALFEAPILVPAHKTLAFSENLLCIAVVVLPFHLAGLHPLVVYNIAFLLGLAFCGYGASVLARLVTRSTAAAIVAGVLYAFPSFHVDHFSHLQILWAGWLPLLLAALLTYWRTPTNLHAFFVAATWLMNALCNIHYLLFGTIAVVVTLLVLRRELLRLAIALGIAALLLLPVLLPYRAVSELYGIRRTQNEAMAGSADLSDWLRASPRSRAYAPYTSEFIPERSLFPGLLSIILTGAALVLPSEKRTWRLLAVDALIVAALIMSYATTDASDIFIMVLVALVIVRWRLAPDAVRMPLPYAIGLLWIAIGVIGSLGLHTPFHQFLYRRLFVFQSIRVPARWASIAFVGFVITNAYGVEALTKRWRIATSIVLVALAVYEVRFYSRWENAPRAVPPVYEWVRATPAAAPLLEMPLSEANDEYFYQLWATVHHRPLVNGVVSGFAPQMYDRINTLSHRPQLTPELTSAIAATGCHTIIVHDDLLRDLAARTHAWIAEELAAGRLRLVGRFDSDAIYAVTANAPPFPPPFAHDSGRATGRIESLQTHERSLTMSGWARSPFGVQRVDVLFQCAGVRVPAKLSGARFTLMLPKRPRGVPRFTDVDVEVIDGRGVGTRLGDIALNW